MAYIGIKPAESFTSFATQTFSTSATSSYTLDHAVTNENELALFINNVRQQPGSGKAYTATATVLTLSANTASTDTMYAIFLGRALQTVNPADGSVATASIAATAVTGAKLNTDVISAQTALAAEPADTDEFLVSDAGVLKRIDYSLIKGSSTHNLLSTQTISSAVAQVDFTSNIDSTYKLYRIDLLSVLPATDNTSFYMRFFQGGSVDEGSVYDYMISKTQANATNTEVAQGVNQAQMILVDTVDNLSEGGIYGSILVFDPSNSNINTNIKHSLCNQRGGDNINQNFGVGRIEETTAVDGFRFLFASGNVASGIFKLYGIT